MSRSGPAWARLARLSLRTKVTLLLLALSLGPLLLAGLVNVNRAVEGGKRGERTRYAQAATFAAANLDGLFTRAHGAVRHLARRFPVETFDFDGAARALKTDGLRPTVGGWRDPLSHTGPDANFSTVFAALADGQVFYAHPYHNIERAPSLRHHTWFESLGPEGGLAMGTLAPLTSKTRPAFISVAPIYDHQRQLVGYVGGVMSSTRLDEIVSATVGDASQDGRALVLLDRSGQIAAGTLSHAIGRAAPTELLALRRIGTSEAMVDGERMLVARASVGQTGWLLQLLIPTHRAYREVYGLIWLLTIVTVLTFVFVLLFADYLATVLLQPIRELEQGAEMFGAGALDYRIDLQTHGGDELGLLASAFNDMGERLLTSRREVEAYSRNLETANQELDAMVYAITHDLKRALRGIEAFATFIEEDYGGRLDTDGVDLVHGIVRNVDRINVLADDLIGLVEQERDQGEVSSFRVGEVLSEARKRALDREQHGEVVVQPDMPRVAADRAQLLLAFDNLISNGLRFNDNPRPRVAISSTDDGVYWRFEVQDNGLGIDPRYHDRIFELFTRLNHADEFPGTGTGLNLVRRIVEAHRGTISVVSAPGEGSTFTVLLPKDPGKLTSPGLRFQTALPPE